MVRPLRGVKAKNFRSLTDVDVDFSDFNVLIGANGSGKSNLLKVLSFVRDTTRFDISQAIAGFGGFDRIIRQSDDAQRLLLTIEGVITEHASGNAKDSYTLELERSGQGFERHEEFRFKRVPGRGQRYKMTASGRDVSIRTAREESAGLRLASGDVSALGALSRVDDEHLGSGPREFFSFLGSIRYLDPDVHLARQPTPIAATQLDDRAGNLSSALFTLKERSPEAFEALKRDMRACLPGLAEITFDMVGGARAAVVTRLHEDGLNQPIDLADASFGTVRALSLLTALHEIDPPALTIIEEVDHGLHPYALDVLVERMREASQRTQVIVASHSPTLVNRLEPTEMIICDRDPDTGASTIPALSATQIGSALAASGAGAGELWFSGALGGVPR